MMVASILSLMLNSLNRGKKTRYGTKKKQAHATMCVKTVIVFLSLRRSCGLKLVAAIDNVFNSVKYKLGFIKSILLPSNQKKKLGESEGVIGKPLIRFLLRREIS